MSRPVVPDPDASRSQPPPTKIGIGPVNLEVALPRWAITTITTCSLLAATGAGGYTTFVKLNQVHQQQLAETEQKAQTKLNEVLIPAYQLRVYDEQNKHQADEEPGDKEVKKQPFAAADGSLEIHHFFRDGCVQVIRRRPGQDAQSKWIFGTVPPPDKPADPAPQSAPAGTRAITLPNPSGITLVSNPAGPGSPHLQNALLDSGRPAPPRAPRCLNPHPGAYTPLNAQVDKCTVIQTRTFADGCINTQRFNTCTGSWEVNQDGSPKVNWTKCVH